MAFQLNAGDNAIFMTHCIKVVAVNLYLKRKFHVPIVTHWVSLVLDYVLETGSSTTVRSRSEDFNVDGDSAG
jgi:hypothetical protein